MGKLITSNEIWVAKALLFLGVICALLYGVFFGFGGGNTTQEKPQPTTASVFVPAEPAPQSTPTSDWLEDANLLRCDGPQGWHTNTLDGREYSCDLVWGIFQDTKWVLKWRPISGGQWTVVTEVPWEESDKK